MQSYEKHLWSHGICPKHATRIWTWICCGSMDSDMPKYNLWHCCCMISWWRRQILLLHPFIFKNLFLRVWEWRCHCTTLYLVKWSWPWKYLVTKVFKTKLMTKVIIFCVCLLRVCEWRQAGFSFQLLCPSTEQLKYHWLKICCNHHYQCNHHHHLHLCIPSAEQLKYHWLKTLYVVIIIINVITITIFIFASHQRGRSNISDKRHCLSWSSLSLPSWSPYHRRAASMSNPTQILKTS